MKQLLLLSLVMLSPFFLSAQLNQAYEHVILKKDSTLTYRTKLTRGLTYRLQVQQEGIDVKLLLQQNGKLVRDQDSPDGTYSMETIDFTPTVSGIYALGVVPKQDAGNNAKGKVSVFLRELNQQELKRIADDQPVLAAENEKQVLTLDIDHFWEAFDLLQYCKTRRDSIHTIQSIYLDRATNGLKDFIRAREFTAEKYVDVIALLPKYWASVRPNIYQVKELEPAINAVFTQFKKIYPNFQPFRVCFAIGIVNTGGTVSDKFVLIGTEITTSTFKVDLSEFTNAEFVKVLARDENFLQRIKDIVGHEAVHIQQGLVKVDSNAVECTLLYTCLKEGGADFIGELTSGGQANAPLKAYGDAHEKELWIQFKNELCNASFSNWLYNYDNVKDKPADLGYYIGYRIAQAYYNHATDKAQAVVDIIEMNDPITFLEKSRYDLQMR